MSDDINIQPSTDPSAVPVATDEVAGRHYQIEKNAWGANNAINQVDDTNAARFPVGGSAIGNPDDASAGTDTGTFSLISLVKRLLSIKLPATLGSKTAATSLSITTATDDANIGAAGDASVAAGATGSLSAKLRRATQGLEDLKTLIVLAAGTAIIGRTMRAETTLNATVIATATLSDVVDCRGYTPVGIVVPSTFDGTQIRFAVSVDGTNFFDLYDAGNNRVVMTVAASRAYPLYGELDGWNYLKVDCATAQATTSTVFIIQLKS